MYILVHGNAFSDNTVVVVADFVCHALGMFYVLFDEVPVVNVVVDNNVVVNVNIYVMNMVDVVVHFLEMVHSEVNIVMMVNCPTS